MNQEEVLAGLKKEVRSLLVSHKGGLDPEQLRRDYKDMMGHHMPLRLLGFRNVMEMVKEMPDVVSVSFMADGSICLKAVSDESTKTIERLVGGQRSCRSAQKAKKARGSYFSPSYSFKPQLVVLPRRGRGPPPLPAHLRAQLRILLSQGPIRICDLELYFLRCFGQPLRALSYGFYSTAEILEAAPELVFIQQTRLGSIVSLREHLLPRALLTRSIFTGEKVPSPKKSPNKCPDTSAPTRTTPSPPGPQKQNPVIPPPPETPKTPESTEAICSEKIQDSESGLKQEDQLFQKCVRKLEEEFKQRILENGVASTISQELKDKLRKVVGQASEGLSVHSLPAEYKRLFGEELPLQQSGFFSVTELLSSMSSTFHLKPAEGDNGHHLIVMAIQDTEGGTQSDPSCTVSPWEAQQGETDDSVTEVTNKELETSSVQDVVSEMYTDIRVHLSSAVPLDAMQGQRLRPPTRRGARELLQVLVEHVESPALFYVRFSHCEEARVLEDMMMKMRCCYSLADVADRYRLPARFVRRGQTCCVSPRGLWFYRAVVQKNVGPAHVEVYFADYGETAVVRISDLKFLKLCYSVLPAQAVPSLLAGVQPTAGSWSAEATASFQKLCCERTLVGALDRYTGDVLHLYLCDTLTDKDVYVHTALVIQGHGTPCSPAESAALCVKVSPVSLYFGEGAMELPELEEKTCSEPRNTPEHSVSATVKVEEEEMPALEFIEVSPQKQDSPVRELGPALTDKPPPTSPTRPASFTLTTPDVIQTKTPPTEASLLPHATLSGSCGQSQTQETEQHRSDIGDALLVTPPPVLHMLTPHNRSFSPIQDRSQVHPFSLVQPRNSGVLFPLFGVW